MEKKRKQWRLSELDWKSEVIVFLLLMASAFSINRGIKIKGLFMDDLYMWSCYGEQTFREFVFPVGGTRCRFVFYLAAYLQMALIGIKLNWFVPCNIIINGLISYTVYRFGMRLSKNRILGFLCGFFYLLSRMAYYQIAQACGLMETLALWFAIGVLYGVYRYLTEKEMPERFFWLANGLYFGVCFVHERYMVLVALLLVALALKGEKNWKRWLLPITLCVLVQVIRLIFIGTLSPAGTGGTTVEETFHLKQAVKFAISQVFFLFGINAGPSYLTALSWEESAAWVQRLVLAADAVLFVLIGAFVCLLVRKKERRTERLKVSALFVIFVGACIACSSVTIRVEVRWIYVSMTAAWLFLAYMCGELAEGEKKRMKLCLGLVATYGVLMYPVETYYRNHFDNIYFWHSQQEYNSLTEETYEKYGDAIFGKKIYILENTYGVTRFYADTFFKTFDPERKAEGTEVIFADSIEEIGTITDDMIVLREDPKAYRYQDITDILKEFQAKEQEDS